MRMNPRLYQAMDLLYLPLMELEQHLKQELTANPFLEMQEPEEEFEEELEGEEDEEEPESEAEAEPEEVEEEVDWEEVLLDGFDSGYRSGSTREQQEMLEKVPETTIDLWDHLLQQLYQNNGYEDGDRRVGEEIIGNINEDGFLSCPVEEIAESADVPVERVEKVLERIQGFDPTGVGARDLQETLLLQITERVGHESLEYSIVKDHFELLSTHKYHDIARALEISPEEVQDAADQIAGFDPKPGRKYAELPSDYVIPDIVVEEVDGEYIVSLNDGDLPRLRISRTYQELARNGQFKGSAKEFAQSKLNSANWIIQAIEQTRTRSSCKRHAAYSG
jgi:RNA polymerase sigma-54 factor